jgi:DNA polymerase-3 subunit alpha
MVYQEQVMQIAQVIGGYTLGNADLLRRAMGKKKQEEMDAQRDSFVAGAEKNGLSKARATALFDLMAKFAGYGFNKSHAAAYALLAYQTAYMKAHHPAAFLAANLSAMMGDSDKVRALAEDGAANGLRLLPPDVNSSSYRFVPVEPRTVRYGLGAIRGTGESAIGAILAARESGPFKSLYDLCHRVDKRRINRRVIEALARAGGFDSVEANRATVLASAGRALEAAERAERMASQSSLFGEADHGAARPDDTTIQAAPWDQKQTLLEEKAALGFSLSGHLFSVYEKDLAGFPRRPLSALGPAEHRVWLAGIVAESRIQMTRRGRMLVIKLDDATAQVEISAYAELLERSRDRVKEDSLLVVLGKALRDEFTGGLRVIAEELLDLAALRSRYATELRLDMNGQADAQRLMTMLAPYRAARAMCQVLVHYENGSASCDVRLGDGWRIAPDERLLGDLSAWLTAENVRLVYSSGAAGG